jgi:mono/diheme cytochrome c family protein
MICMEHVMLYLLGGTIVFFCLFALKTLSNLNKVLAKKTFQYAETWHTMPRLQSAMALGNGVFSVIIGLIIIGLTLFYRSQHPAKTVVSSNSTQGKTAAETPQSTGTVLDLATATVLTDASSLKAGAETFKNLCAACHGQAGEGIVGPNFTDKFWLHGGSFKDVCQIIVKGVPDKGMISWSGQLSGDQIKQVASYILSLEGSNPPNQKAAQGTAFDRPETIPFATRPTAVATVEIPTIGLKGDKKQGQKLFDGILGCAHCHGSGAVGHVDNRNLRTLKSRYLGDASKVYDTVMEIGRMGTAMPPWKHLTMEQKQDIKTFIFSIQESNKH